MNCFEKIAAPGKKMALLIDPDKLSVPAIITTLMSANDSELKMVFVGGSLVSTRFDTTIEIIKKHTDLPVVIFPGSLLQLSAKADALLLLSLVSGRNPDYLIGSHVLAAPFIRKSNLEVISTGYILIDGGKKTSVEYVSNTTSIPSDKIDLIVATAIASEMIGHKLIYLEAGSGATNNVSAETIKEVKKNISVPLIVGGGLNKPERVQEVLNAGADMIVVGNAVEQNIENLGILLNAVK